MSSRRLSPVVTRAVSLLSSFPAFALDQQQINADGGSAVAVNNASLLNASR